MNEMKLISLKEADIFVNLLNFTLEHELSSAQTEYCTKYAYLLIKKISKDSIFFLL